MSEQLKIAAIVLAAGSGSRMQMAEKKQFLPLEGLPVLAYSLLAFEEYPAIDEIVLVTGSEDMDRALEICRQLKLSKVKKITAGGQLRFQSVFNGLASLDPDMDIVLIHDAARPLLTQEIIASCVTGAIRHKACVAAVKEKNTIKRGDTDGFALETLDRSMLYEIQTPQAFSFRLILEAYYKLKKTIEEYHPDVSRITDDAVIVENMTDCRVALVEGNYSNIKITTPEDMVIARALLQNRAAVKKGDENAFS